MVSTILPLASVSASRMSRQSKIHSWRPLGAAVLGFALLAQSAFGQNQSQPEREQLLNGLDVLFWINNGSPDVMLKLRIHSGAAFDLAGKSGEMALLSDILFP